LPLESQALVPHVFSGPLSITFPYTPTLTFNGQPTQWLGITSNLTNIFNDDYCNLATWYPPDFIIPTNLGCGSTFTNWFPSPILVILFWDAVFYREMMDYTGSLPYYADCSLLQFNGIVPSNGGWVGTAQILTDSSGIYCQNNNNPFVGDTVQLEINQLSFLFETSSPCGIYGISANAKLTIPAPPAPTHAPTHAPTPIPIGTAGTLTTLAPTPAPVGLGTSTDTTAAPTPAPVGISGDDPSHNGGSTSGSGGGH